MPLFYYSIYNLRLQSDLPLPGLPASGGRGAADVELYAGSRPGWADESGASVQQEYYVNPRSDESGESLLRVWLTGRGFFRLRYSDGTEFLLDGSGARVWATWPPPLTLEDALTYFLGPVIGFILRLKGTVCLHASAVAVGSRAVAFLGPAGAGKSTTAAAFAGLGYPVLTDDVLGLLQRGRDFLLPPAYPRVRLWPASVRGLFGAGKELPPLTPTWDKRYLDLTSGVYKFQSAPLPLGAIYILGECPGAAAGPLFEPVTPASGLISLVSNAYVSYLLDKKMREKEFAILSGVATSIPLRRLRAGDDFDRITELCHAILEDYRNLSPFALTRAEAS